ncbi:hypothetical protein OOK41_31620 [Micromonospora sp. NBC_01655]|uniref:hypothetical protein n=1 Tax=Micromonospora sp. NBC_01655 TaxID=2975983 RepID=UPI00224FF00E|nr:hypothetical protein [Micromonospora sp. NBC_01655]MCX4474811.1 hypothetical protein [Micromonospora sp. NBC_01655]
MQIQVQGGDRFQVVARRLRTAAERKDLVKELRKGILDAVPALKAAVRADAAAYLPDRYARELVPSMRMTTATTTTGDQVTVRITTTAKGAGGNPRQVAGLEGGRLKHPVFGRSRPLKRHAKHRATSRANPWVTQAVKPKFVTEPMTAARPAVRAEIEAAVDRVLDQITRG